MSTPLKIAGVMSQVRRGQAARKGEPFDEEERAGLARVRDALEGDLARTLRGLLRAGEVKATVRRVDALLESGRFPLPSPTWPAVPWPPF